MQQCQIWVNLQDTNRSTQTSASEITGKGPCGTWVMGSGLGRGLDSVDNAAAKPTSFMDPIYSSPHPVTLPFPLT